MISRVGLIYFPDQQRAQAGIRRAGGGAKALGCLLDARQKCVLLDSGRHIRRRAKLPNRQLGQPGILRLGSDGVLAAAYAQAGLKAIEVRKVDFSRAPAERCRMCAVRA